MGLERFMLPCLNKMIFGIDCPGCGMQRAALLVCKGEFVSAFNMYPPIYTTLLFFIIVGLKFIDRSHDYYKLLIGMAIFDGGFIIISYILKILHQPITI